MSYHAPVTLPEMSQRKELVERIARMVTALRADRTTRVGIDGVDGAGKTVFGNELEDALYRCGRPVIRAGIDSFHNPRQVRYRVGRASPEGFYQHSYDYAQLREVLLDPLSPGGSGRYRRAVFDWVTDSPVDAPIEEAGDGEVLVFDGIFLHHPELGGYGDLSVFLRSRIRDPRPRYSQGQRLYLHECRPEEQATVVIDNNDHEAPIIVKAQSVTELG